MTTLLSAKGLRGDILFEIVSDAIKRLPWPLLAVAALVLCASVACVHSASWSSATGTYAHFGKRQIQWIIIGIAAFTFVQLLPWRAILFLAPAGWVGGVTSLCLVFVFGTVVNGSRRWFSFGTIRVQPSEFMKLALVLMLARVIANSGEDIQKLRGWVLPGLLAGIPFLLVLKQPDLGTALTFVPVVVVMIFMAGARVAHMVGAASLGLISLVPVWNFVLHDYQKGRILSFLNPEEAARGGAYQQLMSIVGIGSGGVLGRGYEQGTQGRLGFCPERHTDFIFSVVGEEFGLVGGLLLLLAYVVMIGLMIRVAVKCHDRSGQLVAMGVATVFAMQVVVNVAMNTGCGPITGLTLPLMSYGGSSMISTFLGLGLVARAARLKPGVFDRP